VSTAAFPSASSAVNQPGFFPLLGLSLVSIAFFVFSLYLNFADPSEPEKAEAPKPEKVERQVQKVRSADWKDCA
jgi:hypothetical protein